MLFLQSQRERRTIKLPKESIIRSSQSRIPTKARRMKERMTTKNVRLNSLSSPSSLSSKGREEEVDKEASVEEADSVGEVDSVEEVPSVEAASNVEEASKVLSGNFNLRLEDKASLMICI